jgi:hypothetical protein
MRRSWTILGILVLLLALSAPAWADPNNANTDTTDLHCEAPVGDITITAVLRSAGLPLHVVDTSSVVVIRESRITVLSSGEVLQFSLAPGIDRGRLVSCTFAETFPELGAVVGEIRVQLTPGGP